MARAQLDIDSLYRRHAETLLVFFVRRTADVETARDLWAETIALAIAGRRRFRGTTEDEAASWLFSIARRQLANFYRSGYAEQKAAKRLALEPPELPPGAERELVRLAALKDLRRALADAMDVLSEDVRHALVLRVVEERSYPALAQELRISEPAARARVSRGLRALAETLEIDDTWEAVTT